MSIRNIQASSSATRHSLAVSQPAANLADDWVRNPSWLSLPAVSNTAEKFVGLHAVFNNPNGSGNFISVTCFGAYTVDWGDGSTPQNYASGVQANYQYTYNTGSMPGTNAPVTLTASTSTVNRTAHGYTNGMKVMFYSIVTTTGIYSNASYYVINATANTFQVSTSLNGSPVTFTGDGSAALLPYQQVIVTITPQVANTFTSINLSLKNPLILAATSNVSGWLDILASGPNLTAYTVSSGTATIYHRYLEQAQLISNNNISAFQNQFFACTALRSVPNWVIRPVANGQTTVSSMFANCYSLVTAPWLNLTGQQSMTSMFSNCYNLRFVPTYDTSSSVSMQSFFSGCSSLQYAPPLNIMNATSVFNMFLNCVSLQTVPLYNTAAVTSASSMFSGCTVLQKVPAMNMSSNTSFGSMFNLCASLQSAPQFSTSAGTIFLGMFSGCTSLTYVPSYDLSNATSLSQMFYNCTSLSFVPASIGYQPKNTTLSQMFANCTALKELPVIYAPLAQAYTNAFSTCTNLKYACIATVTTTLTDTSYMFNGCSSLMSVSMPPLPSSITNANYMFNGCTSLLSIPSINFANASSFTSPFVGASSLTSFYAYNMPSTFIIASGNSLSSAQLQGVFANLAPQSGGASQTLTITSSLASSEGTSVAPTAVLIAGNPNVTIGNTTNVSSGMLVTGTGMGLTTQPVVQPFVANSTFYSTSHNLPNNYPISFSLAFGATGINRYTIYYTTNVTTNTFQVSSNIGGNNVVLGGTVTGNTLILYPNYVSSINGNVVTLNIPPSLTANTNTGFRSLDTSQATMKNWTLVL